jgi:hypothetical protein
MKRRASLLVVVVLTALACGNGKSAPSPPPCDQACEDGSAVAALRETIKLAFNITLQGMEVGPQDATAKCPLGGTVHVFGTATSNAVQGATEVMLTYELDHCAYQSSDSDPKLVFSMTTTGTVTESGTIAVQPSATTALTITSDSITLSGTVYDPPIPYEADACALDLGQNGNDLSGTLCGRTAGLTL